VTRTLLRSATPVTLVGGGPVAADRLAEALGLAPTAVAADGGADVALPAPHRFRAVIGDLDSVGDAVALAAAGVAIHEVAEQDSTDLEKCLYSVSAPLIVGLGFLGGRLDHTLAAMSALRRYPEAAVVLVGMADLCFLCPARLEIPLPAGARVSLHPLAPARGVTGEGLRWPIAGLEMAPGGRIGTSNVATGGTVRIAFDRREVLVILSSDQLGATVAALL
jgi:thiamine pyrophosphokinase